MKNRRLSSRGGPMDLEEWSRTQRRIIDPICVFCDITTEPSIIYQKEEIIVQGWRCPKCGFTLIHPQEIPKAMQVLKEVAKIL